MAKNPQRSAGSSGRATPAPRKRRGLRRFFLWSGIGVLTVLLAGAAAIAIGYATIKLPDPNADFQTNTSFVYFNDGKQQIGSFSIQNRVTLAYADIPQNVKDAIVASENRSFWTDPGFSIPGILRAATSLVSKGDDLASGGSTITQQYIKVLYLTQERTFTRKFTEILLAAKVGSEVSKEKILEGYLNTVYFGRGAYGIEAASQAYFGKAAKKLSLAEAVALTAIVNNPGGLDPGNGAKQAADLLQRYQYTLNGLVEMGKITQQQRDAIYYQLPKFPAISQDSRMGGPKGFLLQMVRQELIADGFTDDQINGGGLKIISTFNAAAQSAAVTAAQKQTLRAAGGSTAKAKNLHAAIASVSVGTGEVLALYGGPDYVKNSRNWATTPRPVGSTFKPYALAAGLRYGFTLNDTFNGNTWTPKGDPSPVTNAGGSQYGTVTLLKATTSSINTAYVDLVSQIPDGGVEVLRAAGDCGLPTVAGWVPNDRVPLGTPEVSPVHQAAGFATFANGGKRTTPHVVKEVRDARGQVLYQTQIVPVQGLEPDVATDVTYALTKVAQDGTGRTASQLGYPVAGKTGTYYTKDKHGRWLTAASWFVGFTKQISTSVMFVAGDQGTSDLEKYVRGFYGAGFPATTWLSYMRVAQSGLPQQSFDAPTKRTSTQTPTLPPITTTPPKPSPTATTSPTQTTTPTVSPTTSTSPSTEPTKTNPGHPTGPPTATTTP